MIKRGIKIDCLQADQAKFFQYKNNRYSMHGRKH